MYANSHPHSANGRTSLIGVAIFAVLTLGAYAVMGWLHAQHNTLRAHITPLTVGWYVGAFVLFILAAAWLEWRPPTQPNRKTILKIIWASAIIARILLLTTTPTLSDDIYRYLWDGYVANNGVSPYALPIDSPQLDYLDIPQRALANNTWMASPYMPAAQWVFRAITFGLPLEPIYLQAVMVIFDLATAAIVAYLLSLIGAPAHRLILYLWNPLIIIEVAHSGHIDAWMVLLMMLAVLTAVMPDQKPAVGWLSPVFLALATLTKILPILLLPILFWRWTWWQRISYGLLSVGLLIPAGVRAGWGLSGERDGTGLFGALRIYNALWDFNSGIFHWLSGWLATVGGDNADQLTKTIILAVMIAILLWAWFMAWQHRDLTSTLRLMMLPLGAYLILTPTVHPWYSLILLVFLPFLPPAKSELNKQDIFMQWLAAAPWLYLSGGLIFSYLTYKDPNDFREFEWVRNLEWWPTLTLILIWLLMYTGRYAKDMPTGRTIRQFSADIFSAEVGKLKPLRSYSFKEQKTYE